MPALPAAARYQLLRAAFPEVWQRGPLKHLASHPGVTPATLSRLRGPR